MKVITICGSLRFEKEMKEAARQLALLGNCVLLPGKNPPGGSKRINRRSDYVRTLL